MERISAYQTTDARIHPDRTIARKHQAWLDLAHLCVEVEPDEALVLARWLVVNRDDLMRLLRTAEEAP